MGMRRVRCPGISKESIPSKPDICRYSESDHTCARSNVYFGHRGTSARGIHVGISRQDVFLHTGISGVPGYSRSRMTVQGNSAVQCYTVQYSFCDHYAG